MMDKEKNNNQQQQRLLSSEIKAVNAQIIKNSLLALAVVLTVISTHIAEIIYWIKDLANSNKHENMTVKGILIGTFGLMTLDGYTMAVRKTLQALAAPRCLIDLTYNKKVRWMLEYVEETYKQFSVGDGMNVAIQIVGLKETVERELNHRDIKTPDLDIRNM